MNLQTIHGHTAVMFAATSGSIDALRLLLNVRGCHAADLTVRDKISGLNVTQLVEREGEDEAREVIWEATDMGWRCAKTSCAAQLLDWSNFSLPSPGGRSDKQRKEAKGIHEEPVGMVFDGDDNDLS